MQKLIYLLWSQVPRDPAQLRIDLLERLAPQILHQQFTQLQINIADDLANCPSPAPKVRNDRPVQAQLNLWVEKLDDRHTVEALLRDNHFDFAAYAARESIYSDYGDNAHAPPRAWLDGQRSPGILALTLLQKPPKLDQPDWMQRWHGRQSPLSEAMQPRTRYVRNVIEQQLTPGAPVYEGIVEECWPSFEHVTNKFLFFGAKNPVQLVWNIFRMLASVTSFLMLPKIRTYMMSEYFIRSSVRPNRLRRIHD